MRRSVSLVAGVLALAGCAAQPDRLATLQAEVEMQLAAPVAMPAAPTPQTDALARDFATALRMALLADPGYRAARATEAQALAQMNVAQSGRRPQLTGSALLGRVEERGGTSPDSTTGASGDLTLSQLLYDGGATTAQIDRATAEALVARAERRVQENAILRDAAQAWVGWRSASARLAALDRRAADMEAMIAQIDRIADAGAFDRSAIDAARGQALDVKLMRKDLQAELLAAEARFARRFGGAPARLGPADLPAQKLQGSQRADAWRQAPALQRAAAEVIAAQAVVAQAQAGFHPELALQLGATAPMQRDDSSDVMAGVRLRYTFHDGGRRKAQLEASRQTLAAREKALHDARLAARAEHASALAQLRILRETLATLDEKAGLVAVQSATTRSQIATGQSDLGQVIAGEVAAWQTQARKIETEAALHMARIEIAAGTGDLARIVGADTP